VVTIWGRGGNGKARRRGDAARDAGGRPGNGRFGPVRAGKIAVGEGLKIAVVKIAVGEG
jgi:hypothetical protein